MATYNISNITIPNGDTAYFQDGSRYYTAGNNLVTATGRGSGYITSSSKTIIITIYTDKSVEEMSTFSLYNFTKLNIRTISGYPYYGTTQIYNLNSLPSGVTATITKAGSNTLRLNLTGTNAFVTSSGGSTSITNNTVLSFEIGSMVVTMS